MKKKQVKIFISQSYSELEKQVNDFLKDRFEENILDVKYNVCFTNEYFLFSCTVFYLSLF